MRYCVLVNPPERIGYSNERTYSGGIGVSRKLKWREKPYLMLPPTDMLLGAAVAEKSGMNVGIVDLLLDRYQGEEAVEYTLDRIRREAGSESEIWIAVRLSIPTLTADLQFANRLKERMPHARVVLFGSVIMTTLDHWVRETNADAVIYGESEAVFGPMLRAEGEAWRHTPGVIDPKTYVAAEGDALYDGSLQKKFARWVQVSELATIPFPAYHLIPLERYSPSGKVSDLAVFITASRGCPIGCTMCPYMLHEGRPLRNSSVERVLEEMTWLNSTYGIHRWRFRDPNFGFDRKYVREILEQVIARGIQMDAAVEVSLECTDDALIALMAKAGVRMITTGIESADEECLSSIGQKIKINETIAKKIALADSLGIHVYGTFVVGAPEESWETVQRTINYAKQVPGECTFTVMTPFPGTPMYYNALQEGLLDKKMTYEKWNSYEPTVRSRFLTAQDLGLARLWARLELIIPYRLNKARAQGTQAFLRQHVRLLPHRVVRVGVRALVAWRRWRGAPPVNSPNRTFTHHTIEKIPLTLKSD